MNDLYTVDKALIKVWQFNGMKELRTRPDEPFENELIELELWLLAYSLLSADNHNLLLSSLDVNQLSNKFVRKLLIYSSLYYQSQDRAVNFEDLRNLCRAAGQFSDIIYNGRIKAHQFGGNWYQLFVYLNQADDMKEYVNEKSFNNVIEYHNKIKGDK